MYLTLGMVHPLNQVSLKEERKIKMRHGEVWVRERRDEEWGRRVGEVIHLKVSQVDKHGKLP